mmetsp:Transcript_21458/g.61246  ORF Transcript_21458/g.61246 Transcript_21458/m.61246 type:complete len:504 (+) Transcript_21458:39-1550(+)
MWQLRPGAVLFHGATSRPNGRAPGASGTYRFSRRAAASSMLPAEQSTLGGPPPRPTTATGRSPFRAACKTTDGNRDFAPPLPASSWIFCRKGLACTAACQMSPPLQETTTATSSTAGSASAPAATCMASCLAACAAGGATATSRAFFRKGRRGSPRECRAKFKVFFKSMAIVMGPTPPGTGVIFAATPFASAKLTSPTSRCPSFFVASSTGLMPTSITVQPGFSHSPRTNSALPMAATTMSASFMYDAMSLVLEWHTVTVASMDCSSCDTGMPTMFDLPMTTALFPETSTPLRWISSMQPAGVQGTAIGGSPPLRQRLPMLTALKPSASLSTRMALSTVASSMCFGSGSWTKIAWTFGSLFNFSTSFKRSFWETVSGRSTSTVWKFTSLAAFFLFRTYDCESFRVPTRITASPGRTPCSRSSACACSLTSERTSAAMALPSISSVSTFPRAASTAFPPWLGLPPMRPKAKPSAKAPPATPQTTAGFMPAALIAQVAATPWGTR